MELLSEKVLENLGPDTRDGGTMRTLDGTEASTSFHKRKKAEAKKNAGGNSLLRGFSQLLSLDGDWGGGGGETPLGEDEKEAEARAVRCVDACRVDEVFADSKFLESDSLTHMVGALVRAAGGKPAVPGEGVPRARVPRVPTQLCRHPPRTWTVTRRCFAWTCSSR